MNDTKPFGVEITLSDVCKNITYGYTASATSENTGVKFLRITDIVPSRIDWESVPFCKISPSDLDKYQIREGDIVIARTGATTGYNKTIKQLPYPAVYASYLIKYDLDRYKADSAFVGYVLQASNWYEYVDAIAGGSAQPGANAKQLGSYTFILPALPEQKAIASVLSSLDDKIDLLHRQNKTLEAMAETLFRQWFIEEAKEDWEIFQLQDLAKLQIGRTPPRKESHWFSDNTNDMKWVSIKDLGAHGIFVTYSSEYLPISTIDHFNIPIIPEGTVMLSFKMTVGRVGIAIENMVSNEAIAQFQIKKRLTSELLYCFLKQFNFDTLGSTSSIVTAVNTALLKGIEIALPEDDLIQEFTEQVKSYFDKVKANQLQIQTLENLRDTLLPKLMSGEVRVQYQTEEVA